VTSSRHEGRPLAAIDRPSTQSSSELRHPVGCSTRLKNREPRGSQNNADSQDFEG
jgi:hypothetical protein